MRVTGRLSHTTSDLSWRGHPCLSAFWKNMGGRIMPCTESMANSFGLHICNAIDQSRQKTDASANLLCDAIWRRAVA